VNKLFVILSKLGGLALAVYGVQIHSISDMSVGAAGAALIHFIDSTWNSPKGTPPTP
jgi:hypothetical protein